MHNLMPHLSSLIHPFTVSTYRSISAAIANNDANNPVEQDKYLDVTLYIATGITHIREKDVPVHFYSAFFSLYR